MKKNKSKEIQNLANEIIAKWKAAVDQEKKKKRPADDTPDSTAEKKVKTEGVKSERKEGASGKVKAESAGESHAYRQVRSVVVTDSTSQLRLPDHRPHPSDR